jgi:CubicO group peptidase (beta-lactamase class C family)
LSSISPLSVSRRVRRWRGSGNRKKREKKPMLQMRRTISLLAIAALALLSPGVPAPAWSQEAPDDEVDRWVLEWMAQRQIPGLSLAVLREGGIEKLRGYGLASLEFHQPATAESVYRLASVTKSFTGAAVMLLVQRGRLSLDDPVERYLDGLPTAWHGITIRRLLTHTSGLPEIATASGSGLEVVAESLPSALDSLRTRPMQFSPGTAWRYNQTNYVLVQSIIETVTGASFAELLSEHLLRPSGMERTTFGGFSAIMENRGPWYSRLQASEEGTLQPTNRLHRLHVDYPEFMLTAGGLNSTVRDLAAWDKALRDGTVLDPAISGELWEPVRLVDGSVARLDGRVMGYGLGWGTVDRPGHRAAFASGGNTVAIHRYLEDDLTVIVLTNCQGAGPNEIAEGVAGFWVPAQESR